jgi:uncharacterized protein YjiS (DUF1127 family)
MRVVVRAQVPRCSGRMVVRAQERREHLSNPREFFRLAAWVERNRLPTADSAADLAALREIRNAFPEMSADEAISRITGAYEGVEETSMHPWIDLSQDIDWDKVRERAQIEERLVPSLEEAFETIKAAREYGIISPEELRVRLDLAHLAERLPSKARARYESEIRQNEQEIEKLRKELEEARHVTKPVFKSGQIVIYRGRPATVSDVDLHDSTWVYTVNQDATDFLARASELSAAPPTTPPPRPRVAVTPELQARVLGAYAAALADLGVPRDQAERVAQEQSLGILTEIRNVRSEAEAERMASVLASEYFRGREEEEARRKTAAAPPTISLLGPIPVPGAVRVRITYSTGDVEWSGVVAQSTARGIRQGTLRIDPTAKVQFFPPDSGPPVAG